MRSIKSLEKGLLILEKISEFPEGARIRDLAEAMDPPISNISLFLNAMIVTGFLTRNTDSGRYCITRKVADIAGRSKKSHHVRLRKAAVPVMTVLRNELNENVLLSVPEGHDIHFIETLQANRSVQIKKDHEGYFPFHVTAAGKAILAFLEPGMRDRYCSEALYHEYTGRSIVNPNDLRKELEEIQRTGYAVNKGEFESEIMAVASPVLDSGEVTASLVVQFPVFRYSIENLAEFGFRICRSAREIEAVLAGKEGVATGGIPG